MRQGGKLIKRKWGNNNSYLIREGGKASGSCQPSITEASFSSLCLLLAHSVSRAPPSEYSKSITLLQLWLLLFNTHLWCNICRYLLINRKLINTTCRCLWVQFHLTKLHVFLWWIGVGVCVSVSVCSNMWGCSFTCVFLCVRVSSINTRCWWWQLSSLREERKMSQPNERKNGWTHFASKQRKSMD